MTSNLGSEIIQEQRDYQEIKSKLNELLFKYFKPEFLNRIDEIITFRPLTPENIQKIAELQIEHLRELLAAQKISLTVSAAGPGQAGRGRLPSRSWAPGRCAASSSRRSRTSCR